MSARETSRVTQRDMVARYVHAVARRLPWRMREDVETELRDLLTEQLDGETGNCDEDRTRKLLIEFGTPAEVASRYHAAPPVIDSIDSRRFWQIAAASLLVVAVLRYSLPQEVVSGASGLDANQRAAVLWLTVVGVMTLVFWAIGAIRRRLERPGFDPLSLPPVPDPDAANRLSHAAAAASAILGTLALVLPGRMLDLVSGGRAAPEAIEAFAYDPTFLAVRAPFVLVGMVLGIVLLIWVGLQGRHSALSRRLELGSTLYINAVLLWSMNAGPVFSSATTDEIAKLAVALVVAITLLDAWWKWDRLRATRARPDMIRAT